MRTFTHAAVLAAALSLAVSATPAFAASGGGTTIAQSTATATPTSADAAIDTQTVSLTKSQTKSVQRRVHVPADGSLGKSTRHAIKHFQHTRDLTLTGRPNVETLRALKLKIADQLEAQLIAAQSGGATTNTPVALLGAPSAAAASALAFAEKETGTPYVSGGSKPGGFDCSGLTMWAYAQAGVTIPRISYDQYKVGASVPKAQLEPGDLVFFDTAGPGASHVGLALSPTKAISATSHGVMEHDISSGYWASHYLGARRLTDTDTAVRASVQ